MKEKLVSSAYHSSPFKIYLRTLLLFHKGKFVSLRIRIPALVWLNEEVGLLEGFPQSDSPLCIFKQLIKGFLLFRGLQIMLIAEYDINAIRWMLRCWNFNPDWEQFYNVFGRRWNSFYRRLWSKLCRYYACHFWLEPRTGSYVCWGRLSDFREWSASYDKLWKKFLEKSRIKAFGYA